MIKNYFTNGKMLTQRGPIWSENSVGDRSLSSKTDEQAFPTRQSAEEVHTVTGIFAPRCDGLAKN